MKLSNDLEYDIHSVSEKEQRMLRRINKYKEEQVLSGENHHLQPSILNMENERRRLGQIQKIKE